MAETLTLGELITLLSSTRQYQKQSDEHVAQITASPQKGTRNAAHALLSADYQNRASSIIAEMNQHPAVGWVRDVCRDEFGDYSPDSLSRMKDRLSRQLKIHPADVADMTLEDFLAVWEDKRKPPEVWPPRGFAGAIEGWQKDIAKCLTNDKNISFESDANVQRSLQEFVNENPNDFRLKLGGKKQKAFLAVRDVGIYAGLKTGMEEVKRESKNKIETG